MKVELRSITCIRYIPTLRVPVVGSRVITAGNVTNGAGSSGQQRWIGRRPRSTSSPVSTTSWMARAADALRHRVRDRLELLQALDLLHEPLRRLHFEYVFELRRHVVERVGAEREAHPPLRSELVDQQRVLAVLRPLEQERRAAGLDDAVGDLGDLEVRVDLGSDAVELALALEERDPVAQVRGRRHAGQSMFANAYSRAASSDMPRPRALAACGSPSGSLSDRSTGRPHSLRIRAAAPARTPARSASSAASASAREAVQAVADARRVAKLGEAPSRIAEAGGGKRDVALSAGRLA